MRLKAACNPFDYHGFVNCLNTDFPGWSNSVPLGRTAAQFRRLAHWNWQALAIGWGDVTKTLFLRIGPDRRLTTLHSRNVLPYRVPDTNYLCSVYRFRELEHCGADLSFFACLSFVDLDEADFNNYTNTNESSPFIFCIFQNAYSYRLSCVSVSLRYCTTAWCQRCLFNF